MNQAFILLLVLIIGAVGGAYAQATLNVNPLSLLKPKAVEALQAYQVAKSTGNALIEEKMRETAQEFLPLDTPNVEAEAKKLKPAIDEVQPQGKPLAPEQK